MSASCDLLQALAERCVSVEIGSGLAEVVYEKPEAYYTDDARNTCPPDRVGDIDWTKPIWEVTAYPNTPVGSYQCIGNDLDECLRWMLDACGPPTPRTRA